MAVLSKADILQVVDLEQESMEIPEWGGTIYVRGATAAERDDYEQSLVGSRVVDDQLKAYTNYHNAKARLVVKCVVDIDGKRVFDDKDADALGSKSAKVIRRIFDRIQSLSGLGAGVVDEMGKNSGGGGVESSPSGSPATWA
jgi:hypothetical protein